jgi:hypothetical protein
MAEAILTGEQVEELAARQAHGLFGLLLAIITRLAKDFFVRHCPRDAGYRNREKQQPRELQTDRQHPELDAAARTKVDRKEADAQDSCANPESKLKIPHLAVI